MSRVQDDWRADQRLAGFLQEHTCIVAVQQLHMCYRCTCIRNIAVFYLVYACPCLNFLYY